MALRQTIERIYSLFPEVAPPKTPLTLRQKLMWTGVALVIFFIMGYIRPWGLSSAANEQLSFFSLVLASQLGSIISAGIGPIVLASIILQLFVGSGIIQLDLSNPDDRAYFTGLQKLLAVVLAFFEAYVYSRSYLVAVPGFEWLVILQVALGSIALMYLDELVMKWGLGSGISLFIAGGVARSMFVRLAGPEGSVLAELWSALSTGALAQAIVPLWIILATVIVFFFVVYAEGIHVEIPITWARARGAGGRYPVKLLYLSNIPVILAAAIFANVQLLAYLAKDVPYLSTVLGQYEQIPTGNGGYRYELVGGLAYYLRPPSALLEKLVTTFATGTPYPGLLMDLVHAFIYIVLLTLTAVFFGKLWLELSGMGPRQIAEQLVRSGFTVPGFRRDPRVVEKVLERYIPVVAVLGSAFVGLLAAFTDVFGGLTSGMGILLAVSIVYRYYELLMREQLLEQHPQVAKVLG
ncbi:MAG: preprotein translocase subunit SecY [Candidatus Diapherotrites archaeon]|nr:preprotein translocase subunit SecY [Candidatus Diapherotrites archaeon]MDN5366945.1 preprotein translocase subunit SecY [Candidatus Diapherotrites archaeon]